MTTTPQLRRVRITGTGMFVPPRVVTNDDLAKRMDTSDEWIQKRTGIKQRHHVEDGMGPTDLAYEASKQALEAAGLEATDIDMIVVATLSPEHYFPGTGVYLQHRLGLERTPAMDIRCQCTGFLYALQTAQMMVGSGLYNRVLLVGAEVHSTTLDFTDRGRDVAVIFGDGAGAMILEASDDETRGIRSVHLHAQGEHADRLRAELPAPAHQPSITAEDVMEGRVFPKMDGKFVFKHAVTRMPEAIMEAIGHNGLSGEDIDLFLFHQANLRINEFVAQMMGIPPEKTHHNIDRFGNCSAASIPMLLDECVRSGRVKPGTTLLMAGFGSGFTWGSAILDW
jgi:3-oxoacyl-[acyl-carrier-protein] synthase III